MYHAQCPCAIEKQIQWCTSIAVIEVEKGIHIEDGGQIIQDLVNHCLLMGTLGQEWIGSDFSFQGLILPAGLRMYFGESSSHYIITSCLLISGISPPFLLQLVYLNILAIYKCLRDLMGHHIFVESVLFPLSSVKKHVCTKCDLKRLYSAWFHRRQH